MDVENIIHQRIKLSTNNHQLSYFFSQLINALSAKVTVTYSKVEVVLQPDELLNMEYYSKPTSCINTIQRNRMVTSSSRMTMNNEIHNLGERMTYIKNFNQTYAAQHDAFANQ